MLEQERWERKRKEKSDNMKCPLLTSHSIGLHYSAMYTAEVAVVTVQKPANRKILKWQKIILSNVKN